jgi:hypothetical protein
LAIVFDNKEHCALFCGCFSEIFGIQPKVYPIENYFEATVNSKVVHWFFNEFLKVKDGVKNDSICFPPVMPTENNPIITALIRGLFDSDGTVIPSNKTVSFSSTSRKIVEEIYDKAMELGIIGSITCWVKKGGFKPLYTFRVFRKSFLKFEELIGFWHPAKKQKLKRLCNTLLVGDSPVV